MQLAYITLFIFLLVFSLIYYSSVKPALNGEVSAKKNTGITFAVLVVFSFVLRIVIALSIEGFPTDISCFKYWADTVYTGGMQNFYFTDGLTDYPPGYMYILYVIGFLKNLFNVSYESSAFSLMIKMPAIVCDIISAFIIYNFANKNKKTAAFSLPLSALYLLNPAVLVNSAAWGQIDSVYTLFVILFICMLYSKKYILSCIVFTVGFMIKPQGVMFAPVLICYFLYRIIFENDAKNTLKQTGIAAAICIPLMLLIALPFTRGFDFLPIIKQYISTIKSYPYASVNAYNLNFIAGGNWTDVNSGFMFMNFGAWSVIFIAASVFAAVFVFLKSEGKKNYFEIGAFVIISVFTLAAKMHERYVFPAMLLLLFSFVINPNKNYLKLYMAISVTQLLNVSIVLQRAAVMNTTAHPDGALPYIIAAANIGILIYMIYILFGKNTAKYVKDKKNIKNGSFKLKKSILRKKLAKADYIIMACVTVIYGVVAFVNLGDVKAAQSHEYITAGTTVKFDLSKEVSSVRYYTGYTQERDVDIYADGAYFGKQSMGSVFAWHDLSVSAKDTIELYFINDCDIIETAFLDENGEMVQYTAAKTENGSDAELLCLNDEQNLVPKEISYKNSTYFDEIYHARTAYEYIYGLTPYENTHPPLGKLFISLGIMIFGMCPFGWRFFGTLFGVIMLPVIYIFARELFSKRRTAAFVMMLLAADFMHFAQTRIATIDVFVTLFIILMFYFMYRYTKLSFYDTALYKTLIPLGLSGICFGFAAASKWTGIYGGAGLCVIFFTCIGERIYEYYKITSMKRPDEDAKNAVKNMKKNILLTILFCIAAFVIVPAAIYCISYIPYLKAPGMEGIKSIIDNQKSMFDYHYNLDATHPFSSQWYEWPLIVRPIWYYSNEISESMRQTIASFGNPFIWWAGLGAVVYMICSCFGGNGKWRTPLFVLIAFLSGYLPWMGVKRCVFIYHFFPCVPFLIISLGYLYENFRNKSSALKNYKNTDITKADIVFWVYAFLCVLLFVLFYPVLSAMTVSGGYIDSLKWFTTWTF